MTDATDAYQELINLPPMRADAITIVTLGGVADIGMNWTLIGYNDAYVLVDAGTTFAPRDTVGVEAVMPDPRIFRILGDRLKALVVTHFHEDHVGAIHRMWPTFTNCPIYAPPFASRMLTNRFQEAGTRGKINLKTFTPGSTLKIGPFRVQTLSVAHSTPDCVGLAFETRARDGRTMRVVHTGDWKIDPEPGIGSRTDMDTFAALGRSGVDLLLCDSTNADRETPQTSELTVQRAMANVFTRAKGMVFVSSFGSNVARMASVAHAAKQARRKVALAGRSLRDAAEAAEALGLTKGVPPFLKDAGKFNGTQRRGCVLMCTGTQGEDNAALAKLSEDRDPRLPRVLPGDVVVHSARVIPGNEEYILAILDRLRSKGAEIVMADDRIDGDAIHVTGHPCREDLRTMYAAVQPKIAMPVHGSPMHLAAHATLARELGVASALEPVDGGVYELAEGRLTCIGQLVLDRVAVLGDGAATLVPWDSAAKMAVLETSDQDRLHAYLEAEHERTQRKLAKLNGSIGQKRPRGGANQKQDQARNRPVASDRSLGERKEMRGAPPREATLTLAGESRPFIVEKARRPRMPAKPAALDKDFIRAFGGFAEANEVPRSSVAVNTTPAESRKPLRRVNGRIDG